MNGLGGGGGKRENVQYESGSSSSDEDGYFSHSPDGLNSASSSPFTTNTTLNSSSYPDLTKGTTAPSKHVISSPPYTPSRRADPRAASGSDACSQKFTVPFFSFTRTSEGSSLCTDLRLLAALFPAHERHMVICSGELDAVDAAVGSTSDDEERSEGDAYGYYDHGGLCGGTLKCLQIDLRRFGLGASLTKLSCPSLFC
jgi:hypothetical protein